MLGDLGVGSTDLEIWVNLDRVGPLAWARVGPSRARTPGLGVEQSFLWQGAAWPGLGHRAAGLSEALCPGGQLQGCSGAAGHRRSARARKPSLLGRGPWGGPGAVILSERASRGPSRWGVLTHYRGDHSAHGLGSRAPALTQDTGVRGLFLTTVGGDSHKPTQGGPTTERLQQGPPCPKPAWAEPACGAHHGIWHTAGAD